MEKLKMHSPNLAESNIAKLAELFPACVTETREEDGKLKRAVDFDLLRQELSETIVEGPQERYDLNWPGKREALLTANAPVAKTLRPCREESVDFDTTQNLFIEGDNLDVLKLLQETYLGKVKMIYIDPPYNTGKDFIYSDHFAESTEEYLRKSNQKDEDGNRLVANTDANGRFHSDWLSMMYPRLKLARNLLKDDGVIFISIDDGEAANLKKLCDEIFGEENFVANILWQKKYAVSNDDPGIASMHDHILVYQKTTMFSRILLPRTEKQLKRYKNLDNDPRGEWSSDNYVSNKSRFERPTLWYPIKHPVTNNDVWPAEDAVWRYSREKHEQMVKENRLYWGPDFSYKKPRLKRFLSEIQGGVVPSTWWPFTEVGHNDEGQKETGKLLGKKIFSTPKPVRLLRQIAKISTSEEDVILDFFSGSCATAHAILDLNEEDGGNRKFIMVQLPEVCDEKSEAYKAGYKTIAEIGKERIRRAGKKIREENAITAHNLDIGFRVLKTDSSNMADVYYAPDAVEQKQLSLLTDNIKDDRSAEDLLFQVLLDWGVDLSLPIAKEIIAKREVFFVDDNVLAACFVKNAEITEDFVKELAKREPLRVVFRDAGFKDDSVKINVEQIFKLMSSHTDIKTI
ncbi:site-specific DNA-methyltransferase [Desulfonema magnum]|uniref:site-specific DNA-methyltransferase (adenine-specific) n=1 Tax=Desulfonema magnum TaxID=45655 RepID=A0A975BGZ7_9BACT|nr:site-specific DNA-methyltransferase [Desulfonema magnum]QTA85564.1 SAM-dependent methyltransferase [Desulfonema magnum]